MGFPFMIVPANVKDMGKDPFQFEPFDDPFRMFYGRIGKDREGQGNGLKKFLKLWIGHQGSFFSLWMNESMVCFHVGKALFGHEPLQGGTIIGKTGLSSRQGFFFRKAEKLDGKLTDPFGRGLFEPISAGIEGIVQIEEDVGNHGKDCTEKGVVPEEARGESSWPGMGFLLCGIVPAMNTVIEWFGLAASVIVAISLMMKNLVRLRLVNLVGSAAFALYGFLIQAWPVFFLNTFIVGVNAFYLWMMKRDSQKPETFGLLEISPKDPYVEHFVDFYREDIRKFFPSFTGISTDVPEVRLCFILRQTVPVSLVVYTKNTSGEVTILLDYAVPAYRDLKNARFFFEQALARIAEGASVIHATAEVPAHGEYLKKIGFIPVETNGATQRYTKKL